MNLAFSIINGFGVINGFLSVGGFLPALTLHTVAVVIRLLCHSL